MTDSHIQNPINDIALTAELAIGVGAVLATTLYYAYQARNKKPQEDVASDAINTFIEKRPKK